MTPASMRQDIYTYYATFTIYSLASDRNTPEFGRNRLYKLRQYLRDNMMQLGIAEVAVSIDNNTGGEMKDEDSEAGEEVEEDDAKDEEIAKENQQIDTGSKKRNKKEKTGTPGNASKKQNPKVKTRIKDASENENINANKNKADAKQPKTKTTEPSPRATRGQRKRALEVTTGVLMIAFSLT